MDSQRGNSSDGIHDRLSPAGSDANGDGLVHDAPFEPLDSQVTDPDAWDDTALIAAFDAAVGSYNKPDRSAKPQQRPKTTPRPQLTEQENGMQHFQGPPENSAQYIPPPEYHPDGQQTSMHASGGSHQSTRLFIPPPPILPVPGAEVDVELEKLLMAWYEAGFRAGCYVSRRHGAMD